MGSYRTWTLVVEGFINVIYILDVATKALYSGWGKYIANRQHKLQTVVTAAHLFDLVFCLTGVTYVRPFKSIRPGVLLIRHRDVRKAASMIVQTIPEVLGLFCALFAFIYSFAVIGIYLFMDTANEYRAQNDSWVDAGVEAELNDSYSTIWIACLQLLVLFSTENWPTLAIPHMNHSWWTLWYVRHPASCFHRASSCSCDRDGS